MGLAQIASISPAKSSMEMEAVLSLLNVKQMSLEPFHWQNCLSPKPEKVPFERK
ncbi:hypothetical protein GCM10023260_02930 [Bartonella acomydis]|uniref:Uncharacterized protein n=1 Tax=Bartonella acomydis TaxID=686234 RepID=A0ABP9MES1_9HYPH